MTKGASVGWFVGAGPLVVVALVVVVVTGASVVVVVVVVVVAGGKVTGAELEEAGD
jgi:hypothetical protein